MKSGQPPLANVVTLGVRDFAAQRDFYRRLRWSLVLDVEDFAVFELRGALLALFPIEQLAADARAQPQTNRDGIGFSIIITVEAPRDVDEMIARFREAGGSISKPPTDAEFFEGRSAYVSDPEGNYWEIAWVAPGNAVVAAARRAAGLGPE
jgi:predicted lactoylglutathione lyase